MVGSIRRPEAVIAGRYRGSDLVLFAHTTALTASQSLQLGAALTPAGPGHPWPDEISTRWRNGGAKKPLIKVEPLVVAEVAADAATQAGQVRHSARFVRLRLYLTPDDVPVLPDATG